MNDLEYEAVLTFLLDYTARVHAGESPRSDDVARLQECCDVIAAGRARDVAPPVSPLNSFTLGRS